MITGIVIGSIFGSICLIYLCICFRKHYCSSAAGGFSNAPKSELWTAENFQVQHPPTRTVMPMDMEVGFPQFALSAYASRDIGAVITGNTIKFHPVPGIEDRMVQTMTRVRDYFEVTVVGRTFGVCVGVGFASTPYPPFRLPGWERNSIAYHSDTGNKFFNDSHQGNSYASGFGAGDVIGCGYRPAHDGSSLAFYFTKNGRPLGVAFTTSYLNQETFACVGSDGECILEVNFGETPFKYPDAAPVYNHAPVAYAPGGYVEQPGYPQGTAPPEQPPSYAMYNQGQPSPPGYVAVSN